MKAYIYSRISSVKQTQGVGLDRQTQNAIDYCERNNLEIHDVSTEIASAFHSKHIQGKLGAFMDLIKSKEIITPSALVVESLDRLGREHELTALSRFIDIIQSGVEIHEISTGITYTAKETALLHVALSIMSRAHNESLMKSKRSKDAIERKIKDGIAGNIIKRHCPVWIDIIQDKFQLNEHAVTVKMVFDLYLNGKSFREIARELQARKIAYPVQQAAKKMKTVSWNSARVSTFLSSCAVYGAYKPLNEPEIENYYPAVVDIATYEKVRLIRETRKMKSVKLNDLTSIVSGCCVCAECHRSYVSVSRNWTNAEGTIEVINLRCNGRLSGIECKNSSVPMKVIEEMILNVLPDIDITKLNRNRMKTLDNLKAALVHVEVEMQNIIDLVAMGSTVAKDKFKALNEKAEQLKLKIEKAETRIVPDTDMIQAERLQVLDSDNKELRLKVNTALQLLGLRIALSVKPYAASYTVEVKRSVIASGCVKWQRKKRIDSK